MIAEVTGKFLEGVVNMFKTIFASAWILAAMGALLLGLNGSIDKTSMVFFSLVALVLFYGFALGTVMVRTRDTRQPSLKSNEST